MAPVGLSATLPLSGYGRVARDSGVIAGAKNFVGLLGCGKNLLNVAAAARPDAAASTISPRPTVSYDDVTPGRAKRLLGEEFSFRPP
jgi:hypothetical protein